MEVHNLKTWPEYYSAVLKGSKKFEVRKRDRNFKVGDILLLDEYDNTTGDYTGRQTSVQVTYILPGGQFGIDSGYCVMGINPITPKS